MDISHAADRFIVDNHVSRFPALVKDGVPHIEAPLASVGPIIDPRTGHLLTAGSEAERISR